MSYILDALRRADAERERGAVPSLHTQQYGALPGDDEAERRGRLPTMVAGLLAAVLLAVLAWHYVGGTTSSRTDAQATATPPAPTPGARPVDPLPASAPAPIPATAPAGSATAPPASTPSAAARRASKREPSSAAATTPTAGNVAAPDKAAAPGKFVAPTTPAPAAGDRVYAIAELPDDVRRDLPKLAFGGASYSSDPSSRMVILNGQVFHEGDVVARGVAIQRVNRKSAILVVRGLRFELVF